jgi:hypothetical protein
MVEGMENAKFAMKLHVGHFLMAISSKAMQCLQELVGYPFPVNGFARDPIACCTTFLSPGDPFF